MLARTKATIGSSLSRTRTKRTRLQGTTAATIRLPRRINPSRTSSKRTSKLRSSLIHPVVMTAPYKDKTSVFSTARGSETLIEMRKRTSLAATRNQTPTTTTPHPCTAKIALKSLQLRKLSSKCKPQKTCIGVSASVMTRSGPP